MSDEIICATCGQPKKSLRDWLLAADSEQMLQYRQNKARDSERDYEEKFSCICHDNLMLERKLKLVEPMQADSVAVRKRIGK